MVVFFYMAGIIEYIIIIIIFIIIVIIYSNGEICLNRQLDVSFNILRKVEGLEQLTRLKKLFLLHNKISSIANLEHLTGLEMLELGSNRIRVRNKAVRSLVKPFVNAAYAVKILPCCCDIMMLKNIIGH